MAIADVVRRGFGPGGDIPQVVTRGFIFTALSQTGPEDGWDDSLREWNDADAIYSESKPIMVQGTKFFQADNGLDFGGQPIRVSLTRTALTVLGRDRSGNWKVDPGIIKEVTGLWPMIRGVPGTVIKISVGGQPTPDEPIRWEGPRDFIVGTDFFLDFIVSDRYISVRFESEGQRPWELLSYDLDLEVVGER